MGDLPARLARLMVAITCGWCAAYVTMRLDGHTRLDAMYVSRDWPILITMVFSGAITFGVARALLARTRPAVDTDDLRELPARIERILTASVFAACGVLLTRIATGRLRLGMGSSN